MPDFVGEPEQLALHLDTVREGVPVPYTMHFPWLPPSKNQYDGWPVTWKSGTKRKWMRAIGQQLAELGVPIGNQRVGLGVLLVFPQKKGRPVPRRDPQNYAQCLWNWIPDALVAAGIIPDDTDGRIQFAEGGTLGVRMVVDRRHWIPENRRQRTTVVVTVERAVPRPAVEQP